MKMDEEKSSLSLPAVLLHLKRLRITLRGSFLRPSASSVSRNYGENEDNISTHRSGHSAYTCMHSDTDTDTQTGHCSAIVINALMFHNADLIIVTKKLLGGGNKKTHIEINL